MSVPFSRYLKRRSTLLALVIFTGFLLTVYPPASLSGAQIGGHAAKPTVLQYSSNGLANGWEVGQRTHPIQELMQLGKERWEALLER